LCYYLRVYVPVWIQWYYLW